MLRFSSKVLTDALGCDSERQLLQQQSQSSSFCPHTHHQCFSLRGASKKAATLKKREKSFLEWLCKRRKRKEKKKKKAV